jgi:CRP/FNR family cyclic AMP-dependent transcriptional regulator
MTAIDDVLSEHPFFAGLDRGLLQRLASCSRPVQFSPDSVILQAGAPADCLYAITKGRVAVGVRVPGRGLQVIETLQAGDILGWSWLFEPYVWTFDAVAVKPVTAFEVGTTCIRSVLDADPAAAAVVYRSVGALMAERLASARLRLVDLFGEGH